MLFSLDFAPKVDWESKTITTILNLHTTTAKIKDNYGQQEIKVCWMNAVAPRERFFDARRT